MDFPQRLMTFLASINQFFIRLICPQSDQARSQIQQPTTSTIDVEMPPPPQTPPSPPPPPPSPAPTWTANLKLQVEAKPAAQEHEHWRKAVLTFCYTYVLQIQFMGNADYDSNHHSLVVLSVLVLVAFTLLLVALFVHQSSSTISQALEKVAFLLSAAAFCHSLSIPFSFELRCAVWAVFLLALLIIIIFMCLNPNTAQC
ncbi:hypothetical protein CCACVL1_09485 [Corchorus capsularis]|uniref:Uncharacterized protein n=1 Tax=Corchorus capsularis TaxID=210143 RepID=A0A1R3IVW5_COCAP|nr:hypothetical protein CCACVL1_09485 [Corchorus capsularis]